MSASQDAAGVSPGWIEALDPKNRDQVEAVSRLHGTLIPSSPVAMMGHYFMTRFYYTRLVADGLIRCDLFRCGKTYTAFSVYTEYPLSFMSEGRRKHPLYVLWILALSVLARPARIGLLMKMTVLAGRRTHTERESNGLGEYLSLGVDPRFVDRAESETGLMTAESLWARAVKRLKASGFTRMMMVVERKNRLAARFHLSRGAKEEPCDFIPATHSLLILNLQVAAVER